MSIKSLILIMLNMYSFFCNDLKVAFDKFSYENGVLVNNSIKLISDKTSTTNSFSYTSYIEQVPDWPESCINSPNQSPVDFPITLSGFETKQTFQFLSANYKLVRGLALGVNEGHHKDSIPKMTLHPETGSVLVNKNGYNYTYNATEVHFHFPSEHTFNGEFGDLEMVIVHKKDSEVTKTTLHGRKLDKDPDLSKDYLHISVLFKAVGNQENQNIRNLKVSNLGPVLNFDLSVYAPINMPFIFYEGSKTTPDCEQNVNWVVLAKMDVMSKSQLKFFLNWILGTYNSKGNSRATKPLGTRKLYYQYYPPPSPAPAPSGKSFFINASSLIIILLMFVFL